MVLQRFVDHCRRIINFDVGCSRTSMMPDSLESQSCFLQWKREILLPGPLWTSRAFWFPLSFWEIQLTLCWPSPSIWSPLLDTWMGERSRLPVSRVATEWQCSMYVKGRWRYPADEVGGCGAIFASCDNCLCILHNICECQGESFTDGSEAEVQRLSECYEQPERLPLQTTVNHWGHRTRDTLWSDFEARI